MSAVDAGPGPGPGGDSTACPVHGCQPGTGQSRPLSPSSSLRGAVIAGVREVLAWGWSKTCGYFHFSVFGPSFRDVWVGGS